MQSRFRMGALPGTAMVFCMVLAGTAPAHSQTNLGFEDSPNFVGWTLVGAGAGSTDPSTAPASATNTITIQQAGYGVTPPEGVNQALILVDSTLGSVSAANLESDLGIPAGALTGAIDGSGITSSSLFSAAPGTVVRFAYDFLTNELDPTLTSHNDDFAFFSIGGVTDVIASVDGSTFLTPEGSSGASDFLDETGYNHAPFSYTIPTAGNYALAFGVVNVGADNTSSGLLLDNITITSPGNTGSSTPEPGSCALLVSLGAAALGLLHRRRAHH